MKIILSRKGFDTQYGGQPSPIFPDGTLLSLPIPMVGESVNFGGLIHDAVSYYDLIKGLYPNTKLTAQVSCHLDPDIRRECVARTARWMPLFGQAGSSLGHLMNNNVGKNDIFLFFGTFRETEFIDNILKYKKGTTDIHLVYGYLQVKKLHTDAEYLQSAFGHHPHANGQFLDKKLNGIFEPNEKLSFNKSLDGSGVLQFHDGLVLTKKGFSKSRWNLPSSFKKANITYHSDSSFKSGYFQSAAKGQEFIISSSKGVERWAEALIEKGASV